MRAILDVNVVIALLDPDHAFHERAHAWWDAHHGQGWASCPLTENGVVRVMSNPGYSRSMRFAPAELVSRLRTFVANSNHEFWADDLTIRDATAVAADRLHGSRQVTDVYLLALAVRRRGRLATFDRSVPLSAVPDAKPRQLAVI